jgi:Short C-terminal domain
MRLRPRPVARVARTAVIAGTATAVSNRVSRRQANKWEGQQQEEQAAEPQPAPQAAPPPASAGGTDVEQLQQLAALHDQGILTDEEFAAKKKQILGL